MTTPPKSQPNQPTELQRAIEDVQLVIDQKLLGPCETLSIHEVNSAAKRLEEVEQLIEQPTGNPRIDLYVSIMRMKIEDLESKLQQCEKERDELKVEYESRVIWIRDMNKILGYDNSDGFHSCPDPHTIAINLTAVAKQLAEVLKLKGRLHVLHDDVSMVASMPLKEWVDYKEQLNKALTAAKQAGLLDDKGGVNE